MVSGLHDLVRMTATQKGAHSSKVNRDNKVIGGSCVYPVGGVCANNAGIPCAVTQQRAEASLGRRLDVVG